MTKENILQELYVDSFFSEDRTKEIIRIIESSTKDKTIIGYLTNWNNLEAKVYIISEFSLTEIHITKRGQHVVCIALNSLVKIQTIKFVKSQYKSGKIRLHFKDYKFEFVCSPTSNRVQEFLKALYKANAELLKN